GGSRRFFGPRNTLGPPPNAYRRNRSWNAGKKRSMSVFALRFRRMRQMTSVKAANDIKNIGMAKYQCCLTKSKNELMLVVPVRPIPGRPAYCGRSSTRASDVMPLSFVTAQSGYRQGKLAETSARL